MEDYKRYIESNKVKLISVSQMSNVLGTIVPINKIIKMAHDKGVKVMVDGSSICSSHASRCSEHGL